jgi:hypothetical protein
MQLHSTPSPAAPVFPVHLSAFVTADLRFDIATIRADAKARYALKLDFINRYTGEPKRHWQRAQARRAIAGAWSEAKLQLHNLVLDRLPDPLPYTPQERARMAQLRATVVGAVPASRPGIAAFKAASGEYKTIQWTAKQRAYFRIFAEARGRGLMAILARCPTCGTFVPTIFEHIDRECENDEARSLAVDWSSAAEATKALDAGILPPGCSLADDGALVVPDREVPQVPRGCSVVLHHFDKVVTVSGLVLKARDDAGPALKAARAL